MNNTTLSIVIMSGKGGVGKTSLSLNLGYALYLESESVLLMDCDLGLANIDVMLGISPAGTMQEVLLGAADIQDVIYPIREPGFALLPAASGMPELANMNGDMQTLFLRRLEPCLQQYSFAIMDLGAGIGDAVQSFARMAHIHVIVLTPEPTSLTDCYALMKVLSSRHGIKDFMVLVNQAESKAEGTDSFNRLATACEHFLGFKPMFLGAIPNDSQMSDAIRKQEPLMSFAPHSDAGKAFTLLARRLLLLKASMKEYLSTKNALCPLDDKEG